MIDISRFTLQRLLPNDERKPFNCADDDLNDFFLNDSAGYDRQLLAVTYVLTDNDTTIAFFSLLNDKIAVDSAQSRRWWRNYFHSKLPEGKRYWSYPAVKIGRFGVDVEYQSMGIGSDLMDYIKGLFLHDNKSGCRFLTVDAYNRERTLNFYLNNHFQYLTSKEPPQNEKTRLMYFDLCSLIDSE